MTQELLCLRDMIDTVDKHLLELLAQRFNFVKMVAAHKSAEGIPARIPARIKAVIENREQTGVSLGLPERAAFNIWTEIVEEACRYEESLMTHAVEENLPEQGIKQRSNQ
ncbi:MAG: chorismate mutase [Parvibaculaceae bacterium]